MKVFLLFILLVTMMSCNQESSVVKSIPENYESAVISDNKDIFGTWGMCATSDSINMIQMNTCQTIKFNSNGTGSVGNESLIKENFIWILKNRGLKIIYPNKNSNSTFIDTFYYSNFNTQKDNINLILTHNNLSYYLSKTVRH